MGNYTRREAELTSALVKQLGLLERGLVLMDRETHLKNPVGASGFVDILARDISGNLVVIEVKVADGPARNAAHEIFKYLRLLRTEYGVPQHKIRCFIVSTTWHELLVPFSELVRVEGSSIITGFEIVVDEVGHIKSASVVKPLPDVPNDLSLCAEQVFFLFDDREQRRFFLKEMPAVLERFSFADFIGVLVDYQGEGDNVFPFGIYFAISKLPETLKPAVLATLSSDHPVYEKDSYEPWTLEKMVISELHGALIEKLADFDRGTPTKFINLFSDWRILNTVRHGPRVTNTAIYSDADLHRLISGVEGENAYTFYFAGTPQHTQSWDHGVKRALQFLGRHHPWTPTLRKYLSEVALNQSRARVSLSINMPKNTLMSLHPAHRAGAFSIGPCIEIFIDAPTNQVIVYGLLEWDGHTKPARPEDIFGNRSLMLVGRSHYKFEQHWAAHGFSWSLFERGTASTTVERLLLRDGALERKSFDGSIANIATFIDQNADYIQSIVEWYPKVLKWNGP